MAVVIVGGGIAGLTAAIALRQTGVEATVFERVHDVAASQLGAGLGLAYNATRVFRRFGLLDQVQEVAWPYEWFEFRSWKGKLLARWPVAEGEVQLGVTRKALHEVLVRSLPGEALVSGRTCVRFDEDDSSVTTVFEDGGTERSDLLIGADGLRSVVRAQIHGAAEPHYAGFSVLRSVVSVSDDSPLPPGVFRLFWGRGASFGMYFVGAGLVYIFGWSKAPEGEHVPHGQRQEALLERFRGWSPEIEALIERCEEESLHQTDIYDRPPVESWGAGRVSLVGDAAHAMTFNMGQGACQGIEDAAVLTRCIAAEGVVPSALRRYESERGKRAAEFTRMSARVAKLSVAGNPLVWRLRNFMLKSAARKIPKGEQNLMIEV